jgi:hypothetical protein
MEIKRRHESAFVICGVLMGFSLGVYTYDAFFRPPHSDRNGFALLLASVCMLIGIVSLAVMRAEIKSQQNETEQKPDAQPVAGKPN